MYEYSEKEDKLEIRLALQRKTKLGKQLRAVKENLIKTK